MYPDLSQSTTSPADIAQLLDEHHLVVLADEPQRRADFAASLAEHLRSHSDTEVIRLDGSRIASLGNLCGQLELALNDGQPIKHTLPGLISLLRKGSSRIRQQFFIWQDADTLLESDVKLFGRVVNTLFGVAAEHEHIDPDVLLIQRVVFIGSDKLRAYAEDEAGQFCSWLLINGSTPFWEAASCVQRPAVLTYRLNG